MECQEMESIFSFVIQGVSLCKDPQCTIPLDHTTWCKPLVLYKDLITVSWTVSSRLVSAVMDVRLVEDAELLEYVFSSMLLILHPSLFLTSILGTSIVTFSADLQNKMTSKHQWVVLKMKYYKMLQYCSESNNDKQKE